ncbi:hypothetical protein [Microlunatus ginsengisoli]|uniref:hypothetical protein n=1 Tax=Microlunatus ginsengisoli TaxID=363863 RepID=UPI0031DA5720
MSNRATPPGVEPRQAGLRWHQALGYALLGRVDPALGTQDRPDPAALMADLDRRYESGRQGLLDAVARARAGAGGWPYVVPDDLRAGLGAAQFAAALGELRRVLGAEGGPRLVLSDRRLDAAEQALLRDVPPHHGS